MTRRLQCLLLASLALPAMALPALAQVAKAGLGSIPRDSWPTYNGDQTGRRFSELNQLNEASIARLQQQWTYRIDTKSGGSERARNAVLSIKSTPLFLDGVLYFTVPDHIYALDARTGKELWTYAWTDKGGHILGNRGVGHYKGTLYFVGPDGWLIALDAKSGKEKWRKELVDARKQYFTTIAPTVVKNHLLVGVGGDAMDLGGFLLALNPEDGSTQWKWNATPRKGEPGIETWPDEKAAAVGGGMTWIPGTFDPDLNLLYWGTGNTNPVYSGKTRAGANLWTASIVALDIDTGKLRWYYQISPHDTHDWDNIETPILFNAVIDGHERKLLSQAGRNGYFVTLDRVTGKSLVTKPFVSLNWSKGISDRGEPIPDPAKEPSIPGSLTIGSATNWMPPAYSPRSGLFYVNGTQSWEIYYLTDLDPKPAGYAGTTTAVGEPKHFLGAIDVKTGDFAWKHVFPFAPGTRVAGGSAGVLTTAGGLVITGDHQGSLIAFRDRDGKILWHTPLQASVTNGPITVQQDDRQWLFVGAGDTMYAYALGK